MLTHCVTTKLFVYMSIQEHRILFVEDDVDDRYIMHQAFAEMGWVDHVKMFSNGEDFFTYLRNLPNELNYPSLIVLDYNIPGLNGAELLSRLKNNELFASIPVVIYSTSMKPLLAEALKIKGAYECFQKGLYETEYRHLAQTFRKIAEGLPFTESVA